MMRTRGRRSTAQDFDSESVVRRALYLDPSYHPATPHLMISRVWHGWTTHANARAYERLLRDTILPGILGRGLAGYGGAWLYRRDLPEEVEFVTTMLFDSVDAVRAFAGPEYEVAVVPPAARALLARFDARAAHYDVLLVPDGRTQTGAAAFANRERS